MQNWNLVNWYETAPASAASRLPGQEVKWKIECLGFLFVDSALSPFCPRNGSCCGITAGGYVNLLTAKTFSVLLREWSQPPSQTPPCLHKLGGGKELGKVSTVPSSSSTSQKPTYTHTIERNNWLPKWTHLQCHLLATAPPQLAAGFSYIEKQEPPTTAVPVLFTSLLPGARAGQENV